MDDSSRTSVLIPAKLGNLGESIPVIPGDFSARWLPRISLACGLLAGVDTLAACVGLHSIWSGCALLVAMASAVIVVCGAFIWGWGEGLIASGSSATPIRWRVVGLAVLLVPLWYVFTRLVHPPEPALGNEDQGIYCLSAVNLARTDTYLVSAPIFADAPTEVARSLFTTPTRAEALRGDSMAAQGNLAYFGFFQDPANAQILNPTFPPGYPVYLSDCFLLAGWPALGWANALLVGALAVTAGLLVQRWFGVVAGCFALVVLLLNPLTLWSANTLYAEPLLAWFWMLGLLCLDYAGQERRRLNVIAAGVLMGIGMLIKIDALPIILWTIVIAAIWWWQGRRHEAVLLAVSTGTMLALSVIVLLEFNRLYFAGSLHALLQVARSPWVVAITILAVLLAGSSWIGLRECRESMVRGMRIVAIVLVVAGAGYAYFIRPFSTSPDQFFYWPQNRMIPSLREQTFLRLGWYVGGAGLIAMVCGLGGLIWTMRSAAACAAIALGIGTGAFLCYDLYNNPVQPYAMRRLAVFAVPMLSVAIALWWLPFMRLDRWWKAMIASVGVAITLLTMLRVDAQLFQRANYGGLVAQMDAIADALPQGAVVILGRNDPCCLLAPFLHLAKGKDVVLYNLPLDARAQIAWDQVMAAWRRAGRRIFHVALRFDLPIAPRAQVLPPHRGILDYNVLPNFADHLPIGPERVVREYQVSEIR